MKKIQLPSIGGIRKVIKVGNDTTPGTTIVEVGSASITLAQLRQLLGITSTPSNPSGTATPVLTPGPGLQGGGPLVGNVQLRLTAPGFIDIEGSGAQGEDGAPGPAGARGPTGAQGPMGPPVYLETDPPLDGDPGPPGPPGSNGATGAQGPMGPPVYLETDPPLDGDPGPPGPPGSNGATGAQGPQGVPTYLEADPGLDGDMGPPGRDGAAGATGAQGPQGVPTYLEADPGLDGDMGPPGRDGAAGAPGAQGVPGAALFFLAENGDDGERGPPGQAGVAGANGAQGPGGPPGLDGEPGVDGDAGPPGPQGPAGAPGTQTVTFINAAVSPDSKPLNPQTIDDEFDVGSSIDTAGARRQGAAGWSAFSLSTGSTTVNQGYLRFAPALTASRNFGGYSVPLSGAFDVRAKLTNWNQQTNSLGGIALATSSGASGNIMIFGLNNATYVVQRLTNATTFSANAFTSASGPANGVPLYLRITSDLTNLRFYVSSSGVENTFALLYTEALATFIGTVGQLVIGCDNEDAVNQSFVDVDWVRDYTAGYAPATSGNGIGPPGPAIYLEAEAGQDGDMGPPGQPGPAGAAGAAGSPGVATYMEAEMLEPELPIPGPVGAAGAAGATGAQGPAGPPLYFLLDDVEPGERGPPGPQGAAGGGGGGSFSATQVTVNLPYPASRQHSVVVTDAAITATDKIFVTPAGITDTGTNDLDMLELLGCAALPAAGSFTLKLYFLTPIAGPLVINYARAA